MIPPAYCLALPGPGQAQPAWLARLVEAPPQNVGVSWLEAGGFLFTAGRTAPQATERGGHILIGEAYGKGGSAPFDLAGLAGCPTPETVIIDRAWGSYVYLHREGEHITVLRDPSGTHEALVWRRDGVILVAGGLPDWLDPALPPDLTLDWDRIAAFAAAPAAQTGALALQGVEALAPGEAWRDGTGRQIWSPAAFAPRRRRSPPADPALLVETVDQVVCALAGGRVLIEVSGGLDSAIIASALVRSGADIACAINYRGEDPQSDERGYARDAAARLGLQLVEAQMAEHPLDLDALSVLSTGPRPARNAFDQAHDRDMAELCARSGIDVILTGQGGDNILFQTPTPLICADALVGGLRPGDLLGLARWQHRSVYGLLGAAIRARLSPPRPGGPPAYLTPAAARAAAEVQVHPWLAGLDGLRPAKRLQIASLASALIVQAVSLRGAEARLRHPLISQPVMELCLSLEPMDLTRGGRDRGLARAAFADRLPASILERTTKGRLSSHYGRIFAASLADVRPLLLEGRLVAEGVVHADVLDQMLTREHLIWRGGYGVLINLVMLELWVRAWTARLADFSAGRPGA